MASYPIGSATASVDRPLQNSNLGDSLTATCQREVMRCRRCQLVQFRTISGLCRRCAEPLAPRPQPTVSPSSSPSAAANRDSIAAAPAASSPAKNLRRHDPELRNKITRELALGQTIRALRESKNLTQQQVATKAGVPRTYVSRVEHSHLLPGTAMIHRLANALAVGVMDLFCNRSCHGNTNNDDLAVPEGAFWNSFARYFGQLQEEQQATVVYRVRGMLCESLQREYRSGVEIGSPRLRAQKAASLQQACH